MSETLLPPNASELERSIETATAAQLSKIPQQIRLTTSAALIPSVWLPWLAWARRVETWDTQWPEDNKRATIQASYQVHRVKGTIGAMRKALKALDVTINIVEWFEDVPKAAPYTFRVTLTPLSGGISSDTLRSLTRIIENTKNVRSHLAEIVTQDAHNAKTTYGGANVYGLHLTIKAG